MNLILKIAWRNILRHKGKSLVIGSILFLGAFLMTLGNGVVSGMDRGIQRNIVNGFLGDLVLVSDKQKSDNVLLGFMGASIEAITNYKDIKKVLAAQVSVDRFLPVGKNLAFALSSNSSNPGAMYLLGVDFEAYRKMFPDTLTVVEGRLLESGERGILVPTSAREEFYDYTNEWLLPEGGTLVKENLSKEAQKNADGLTTSQDVVLLGMSETNSATDIRFRAKGIVKYRALNTIFGHFSLADIESYRECLGYFSSADKAVEVPKEEQKLLGLETDDLDSLFSDEALIVDNERASAVRPSRPKTSASAAAPADLEDGAYNLILVKLKDGAAPSASLKSLNQALSAANTGVRGISWRTAAGPLGSMTSLIKGSLFLFVTLLFVVAVIIIVNTLTMSALERTSELGMMRAIGAKKSFIGGMFLGETGMLAAVFGGAGILAGVIVINVVPLLNITTANDMVQLLYGGDTFHPVLSLAGIVLTLLQLAFVTILAALYPVQVARSITPLDAVSRD